MLCSTFVSFIALLAAGVSAQSTVTTTVTSTVTSVQTAQPSTFYKSSPTINNYICMDRYELICFQYGSGTPSLTEDSSRYTQWHAYYGQIHDSYFGNIASVPNAIQGGYLVFGGQASGNFVLDCYYKNAKKNKYNCFNGAGNQFTWYRNTTDNTVGLGLTAPNGTVAFQAHWIELA